ncbi:helix-turn-helix domain-containing protein [Vibrio campbellii]
MDQETQNAKSCLLLHETKNSVTDIALDVGIRQVSNFSKMFKSYSGVAPNQFRKSLYPKHRHLLIF